MRIATAAFRRSLADGRADYKNRAVITLSNGYVLTGTKTTIDEDTGEETVETVNYLTNENIWTDGLSVEDAVSNDNVFQIGATIINQAKLIINNINDEYSAYDFNGANVVLYVGMNDLDDGGSDELLMGTYTVASPEYDNGIITLTCLDYMTKFDKPYTGHISYPATLAEIVRDCCSKCAVTQGALYSTFPHSTYEVQQAPSGESTTYRQVLSWAAQIAGCFARCNASGELEVKFYDFAGLAQAQNNLDGGTFDSGTPSYASGDTADGGSFNPWNTGYIYDAGGFIGGPQVHLINSDFSAKLATDNVVITEVRVSEKVNTELLSSYADAYSNAATYNVGDYAYYENNLYQCIVRITTPEEFNRDHWTQISIKTSASGTAGYAIVIENNDLIMGDTAKTIADFLIADLGGITFRPANITHPSNPTIEAGDTALFFDRKGNRYPIIVSSTNFTSGNSQNTVSSAETPARNSSQRFTQATANYVAMREQVERQTKYLNQIIEDASGLYCTQETQPDGSVITYYHEKKLKSDSQLVMSFSTSGFSVTADYQTPQTQGGPTWYGITFDGQFFASVINTIGLFFDYAHGGTLTLGGADTDPSNPDGGVNGILRMLNASNQEIGRWDNTGITAMNLTAYGSLVCYESYTITNS